MLQVGHVLPRRAPELLAGGEIEGGEERVVEDVALQVHDALVDDRRAGDAPLRVGRLEVRRVEGPEVLLPEEPAVDVVAVEALGAEEDDDPLPVRGGGRVRVCRLGVAGPAGHALVGGALPEDLPRPLVDPVDDVAVRGLGRDGLDVAVEAHLEGRRAGGAHRGGQVDAVAPDDRGRVGEPGHRRPPREARLRVDVPGHRHRVSLGDPARPRAAEAGPVRRRRVRGERGRDERASEQKGGGKAHRHPPFRKLDAPLKHEIPSVGAAILGEPVTASRPFWAVEETLKLVSSTSLAIAVLLAAALLASPAGHAAEVERRGPLARLARRRPGHRPRRAPPAGVDRRPQRRLEGGDPGARPLLADRVGRSPVPHHGDRGRRRARREGRQARGGGPGIRPPRRDGRRPPAHVQAARRSTRRTGASCGSGRRGRAPRSTRGTRRRASPPPPPSRTASASTRTSAPRASTPTTSTGSSPGSSTPASWGRWASASGPRPSSTATS